MLLSLRKLKACGIQEVFALLHHRSALQLTLLSALTLHHRPASILDKIYGDTVESCVKLRSKDVNESALSRNMIVDASKSLDARHAGIPELLADTFTRKDSPKQNDRRDVSNKCKLFLHRHASVMCLLQQSIALISREKASTVECVQEVDLSDLVVEAKNQSRSLAEHAHGIAPDIHIESVGGAYTSKVTCIPSMLSFAMTEILKNALYATIMRHIINKGYQIDPTMIDSGDIVDDDIGILLPPIGVRIHAYEDEVTVEFMDDGTGMTSEEQANCLEFLWKNSLNSDSMVDRNASYQPMTAPLQGLGVGLCLSSVYVSHFGGSLEVYSKGKDGGVTVTIRMPRSIDIEEDIDA